MIAASKGALFYLDYSWILWLLQNQYWLTNEWYATGVVSEPTLQAVAKKNNFMKINFESKSRIESKNIPGHFGKKAASITYSKGL